MSRIRTALAVATAGAALTTSFAVAAAPAQAATATSFCFAWTTGAAYANYPVMLYSVDSTGRAISLLRNGKSASNGCGTFSSTPSNVRLRVYAGLSAGGGYFAGATPLMSNTGAGGVHLGTGYVSQIW